MILIERIQFLLWFNGNSVIKKFAGCKFSLKLYPVVLQYVATALLDAKTEKSFELDLGRLVKLMVC